MSNKFYITTAILYTNGPPHLGFAFELLQADAIARYHRLAGDDVFFLTGTDEHGATVVKGAAKHGKPVDVFVDEMAELAKKLTKILNISNDDFIRTSDQVRHWPSAQKIWKKIEENGDLYKKEYEGMYCVGHEAFIKKSDLVDGVCPLHKTEPEKIKEENWFFKLTKYKKEIKQEIKSDELKIVPETRKKEILNLLDDAEDVSFSRPSKDLTWGIPVPNDPTQTQYVWTDALTNYISALGYGSSKSDNGKERSELFERYWPADVHLIGKDILRFHGLIWPAMLLSAGLSLPKSIYVHGFINIDGQKMSKTIGNVIDPFVVVEKYDVDVVRYFLLREIPSGEDGDFSYKKLEERHNGDLANGLGNLVQRTATLVETMLNGELIFKEELVEKEINDMRQTTSLKIKNNIESFKLHEALANIWEIVAYANAYVDNKKPWMFKDKPEEFLKVMTNLVSMITFISWNLYPFLPETSDKIFEIFGIEKRIDEPLNNYRLRIKKGEPLFPRLKK